MSDYDYIVVGAGLFGSTFAHKANKAGEKVLVLERRNHIAGNTFTENISGINVHKYGAHIFHTNNRDVWDFVNQFADFNRYTNSPIANYKGEIYSLPFNMYTFNKMFGCVTPDEAQKIVAEQRNESKIDVPSNLEEQAISLVGKTIYEKLVKGYTEKQWGRECKELPPSIIKRLPVRYTYDNNYFNALFQGIPIGGYTRMVERMLEGIEVRLGVDYLKEKEQFDSLTKKVIYTGAIDEYYGYEFGKLKYRTLKFETEKLNLNNYQGNAVVNYTDKEARYTRIIEHKWFEFGKDNSGNEIEGTIISKEYPKEWEETDEPYYPINDDANNILLKKYQEKALSDTKVIFGGRLGEYKYYDMDQVIESALKLCNRVIV